MRRLWRRLTGANVLALEAEVEQLQTHVQVLQEEYDALSDAVVNLQGEITEVTDGQVEFIPRVVCAEQPLIREHNHKQFYALVQRE